MTSTPGTETNVAVWAVEPDTIDLTAITSVSPIDVLEDAIFNAGASTAIVERLTAARTEHMALWDHKFAQELSDAQADVAGAREKALALLQELGIKNKSYGHWTAQDVVRNDVKIIDTTQVRASLAAHGRLIECLILDPVVVKRIAKEIAIGGIETVATHSLRLTRSGE